MVNTTIFNVEEELKEVMTEDNQADLQMIIKEFKAKHYPNVLDKLKEYRPKYEDDYTLNKNFVYIQTIAHAEMSEYKQAKEILYALYKENKNPTLEELLLQGQLAFMCDVKLARRIMSSAVGKMDETENMDKDEWAHGYMVLGETEEHLEKFVRASKYYKRALDIHEEMDNDPEKEPEYAYMILYLHFKIGMLYSRTNKFDDAVYYLKKASELAKTYNNPQLDVFSLVSMAKMYGSREDNKQAYIYAKEAESIIEGTELEESRIYAEALAEVAYCHFNLRELDGAAEYYGKALKEYIDGDTPVPQRTMGMIYMQYAYSLEHKEKKDIQKAGIQYEQAISHLEKAHDWELLENSLADVISFFDVQGNDKKKRQYENKFVQFSQQQQG